MDSNNRIASMFWALRTGLGATAFLAGADKFTNLLTDWEKYIAPKASEKLPLSNKNFMRIVGIIEMLVGIGILSPKVEISSYAASTWLTCIAGNLVLNHDYDIAVRDLNMAIGAFVLARLSAMRAQETNARKPFAVESELAA
ncbi:MAG TPA: hypothetical protein VG498_17540 [Terriglobales bacterium]|nr:hypothetical protein [Terriglobales bacterium]